MRYFNIRFKLPHVDEWSYMISSGTEKDIDDDVASLKQAGFVAMKGEFYVSEAC